MIITTNSQKNTYSAYHIAKAFFPNEEIETKIDENGEDPRDLYLRLRKETGRDLPWGMLTGVRPTKLAMGKVKEHMPLEDFEKWFYQNRFVSKEKADLAYEIAAKEEALLQQAGINLGEDSFSLYVNIPFCPSICTYCSFPSGAITDYAGCMEEYLTCLFRELDVVREICEGKKLTSIYIGGGTPTVLTEAQLETLLAGIRSRFSADAVEFTLEAGRPDTINREKLQIAKAYGITRISINPQTMQQKTLDLIGRRHTPQQIEDAFALAREEGFDNINMDLIMGLPGEDLKDAEDTLEKIGRMRPDSLTVHSLAIKRTSQLFAQTTDAKTVEAMLQAAASFARENGYEPYYLYRQKGIAGNFENTGWAMPGKACLYNILIMEEVQSILAVGAGASTKRIQMEETLESGQKLQFRRSHNVSDIREYLGRIDEMIERKRELFI